MLPFLVLPDVGGVPSEAQGLSLCDAMATPRFAFIPARWLAPDSPLTANERLVLSVLCLWTNSRTAECFPSVATIAAHCQLSERTVQRAIPALVKAGAIVCEHRRNGDKNLPNLYTVIGYDPPMRGGDSLTPGVVTQGHQTGDTDGKRVVSGSHPNYQVLNKLKELPGGAGNGLVAIPPAKDVTVVDNGKRLYLAVGA